MRLRRSLSATLFLSPMIFLVAGILFRANSINQSLGDYLNCVDCYGEFALYSDFLILSLVTFLLFLSSLKSTLLSLLSKSAALLLVFFYFLDILVFQYFNKRLFFSDMSIYAVQWGPIWDHIHGFLDSKLLAIVLLSAIALYAGLFASLARGFDRRISFPMLAVSLLTALLYSSRTSSNYINYWILDNFLIANMQTNEPKMYSKELIDQLQDFNQNSDNCYTGLDKKANVIVLLVESWSSYQSNLLSGIEDWTPQLDKLALDNHYFTQFYANGFTTNNGLISSLTPIQLDAVFENLFLRADSFQGTWHFPESLPNLVKQHGYTSAFLTTGPLDFTNKGPWLESLNFDHIEGNEAEFYKNWPIISFHAASDEALFQRSIEWISTQQKPYFLAIENVSTHPPYIDPVSGNRSMEQTFRFVDREIEKFTRELKRINFFDNGILIIASDHRSMDLVSQQEVSRFGMAASSLVPMIMIAPKLNISMPNEINNIYQQSDLYFSIRHLLHKGEVCAKTNEASIFEPRETPDKCALHLRGLENGTVDTICAETKGRVILNGDDSYFIINDGLDSSRQEQLLKIIAWQRVQLFNNQQKHPNPD